MYIYNLYIYITLFINFLLIVAILFYKTKAILLKFFLNILTYIYNVYQIFVNILILLTSPADLKSLIFTLTTLLLEHLKHNITFSLFMLDLFIVVHNNFLYKYNLLKTLNFLVKISNSLIKNLNSLIKFYKTNPHFIYIIPLLVITGIIYLIYLFFLIILNDGFFFIGSPGDNNLGEGGGGNNLGGSSNPDPHSTWGFMHNDQKSPQGSDRDAEGSTDPDYVSPPRGSDRDAEGSTDPDYVSPPRGSDRDAAGSTDSDYVSIPDYVSPPPGSKLDAGGTTDPNYVSPPQGSDRDAEGSTDSDYASSVNSDISSGDKPLQDAVCGSHSKSNQITSTRRVNIERRLDNFEKRIEENNAHYRNGTWHKGYNPLYNKPRAVDLNSDWRTAIARLNTIKRTVNHRCPKNQAAFNNIGRVVKRLNDIRRNNKK